MRRSRFSRLRTAAVMVGAALAPAGLRAQPQTVPLPPPAEVPASPNNREPASYRDVVKKVVPAVVSIEAKSSVAKPAAAPARRPLPPGVPEEYRRYFEDVPPPAGKQTDPDLGYGSGVIIDPAGVVLTAYHVVEGADSVEVELQDGRKFTSKDIRRDLKTDLAVVILTPDKPLPALPFADSDAAEVGDRVLAVGAPFGLTGSVTHGIISAKSRQNLKLNQYEDFVQTDAPINPGNSGGPLVTLDAKVLGICSAIKTKTGGFQGVGLAISSNLAKDVVAQLQKDGVVRRGYLGVGIRELDDTLAARFGVPKGSGVVVVRVYDRSPGAKAGIKPGDVITSVAGTPVADMNTLPRVVAKLPLNKPADLVYIRDGRPTAVPVTIEEQPGQYRAGSSPVLPVPATIAPVGTAGLTVADLTPAAADALGYPRDTKGALIAAVDRAGPAADAGLIRGRVVVKVDQTPVATAKEFAAALAAASPERGALLHVLRPSGEVEFVVLKVK